LSLLLIYYSTDSLFFMTLGIFLTIFFLVLGKIFLVSIVKRLKE